MDERKDSGAGGAGGGKIHSVVTLQITFTCGKESFFFFLFFLLAHFDH